jgi:putative (di)nucleoside polyphosphate hydrolase
MLILNDRKGLLLIHEKGEKETYWKFPQGGIEKGEKAEDTIRRELREEVGITDYQILAKSAYIHRYDWPEEMQKRKGYRGQEQHVYLISATHPKQAKPMEEGILGLEWTPYEEALKRFQFPNQITATQKVWEEFEPIIKKKLLF